MKRAKVFKYREPKGAELAKIVWERCEKNVARVRREQLSRSGLGSVRITALRPNPHAPGAFVFSIHGQTPEEARALHATWRKAYGEKSLNEQLLEREFRDFHGKRFGYDVRVHIYTDPTFDVSVTADPSAPGAILSCLESTYNDVVQEFGEPA